MSDEPTTHRAALRREALELRRRLAELEQAADPARDAAPIPAAVRQAILLAARRTVHTEPDEAAD